MNIAIDIDDTLAQTFEYFVPFVAEYFGVDEAELWERNISVDNLPYPDYAEACFPLLRSEPASPPAGAAFPHSRGRMPIPYTHQRDCLLPAAGNHSRNN